MDDTTFDAVRRICAQVLREPAESIKPDADLRSDLGADSMDATDIAMHLEEQLGIVMTDAELDQARTVGDLARLVEAKGKVPA